MSGLLAGCHAIAFDGSRVMAVDGFAAIPSGSGEMTDLEIPFGDEPVVYSIGPASCAVPGMPAALGECRSGWTPAVETALRAGARARRHRCPTPGDARAIARDARWALLARARGRPLHAGRRDTRQRGPPRSAGSRAGAGGARRGRGRERLPRLARRSARRGRRLVLDASDLASYRALWREPVLVPYAGRRVATRGGLSGVPELLPRMPTLRGSTSAERVLALVDAFEPKAPRASTRRTWSRSTATAARACSPTRSASAPARGFPASTSS
jgi:gamma-glutamyltranspeptidase/glutathione hydrolase